MELLKRPLSEYIAHRFGNGAELVSETRFTRGSSRVTWFVDYRPSPGAAVRSVVFRSDLKGGSTISSSLEQEHFMYERLGRTNVPVAKVICWDDDPEWVARPLFIREKLEGSWELPDFVNPDPKFDEYRIQISKEHLDKLALIHTVDWKKLGFDERLKAPISREDCAHNFIDTIMAPFWEFQVEPIPIALIGLDWLKKRAPIAPRISLCKGTNGLGEEVFNNHKIVAMSDWEEASIGDPAADFASLQNFIPEINKDGKNIWGLEKALAYYREISGIPLAIENVQYYFIVRALNTIVYGQKAASVIHKGLADIRQGWTGSEVAFIGKRLLASMIGVTPPMDSSWFAELNETIL
jgi:aminoglycoside phosphotransferase (APT) family kinase protein